MLEVLGESPGRLLAGICPGTGVLPLGRRYRSTATVSVVIGMLSGGLSWPKDTFSE